MQELDRGSFILFQKGARIGEERFVIREERAGNAGPIYRAGAELNLKVDSRTMRVSVALEATGPRARPRRYEAQINGAQATTVLVTQVGDRIRLDVLSPSGDEMKEFLMRGRVAIADRLIAHHYFFFTKVLGAEPSAEALVLVPQDRTQEPVRIVDRGSELTRVGGQELSLRHIVVSNRSGTEHHVWLDGDRVLKVEVPDTGYLAIRSDGSLQNLQ